MKFVSDSAFSQAVRLAAAVLLAWYPCAAQAATLLFDFGGTGTATTINGPAPDDPVNHWNNVTTTIGTSNTGQLLNLVTTSNVATGINLLMLSRFNSVNSNGTTGSTLFPEDATRDSLYGNTELFGGLTDVFPSFKLTGLDINLSYDFLFYASRTSVSDNRETAYTVTGASAETAFLNASNNVNDFVTVTGVVPNAQGEIIIALGPGPNNTNSNHFTYLNAMSVTVVPEPGRVMLILVGLLGIGCRRKR